jgi:hypothetical protein
VLNGSSISIIFSAFDEIGWVNATVIYFVNQAPMVTFDPSGPLTLPVIEPPEDLQVKVSIISSIVKYRFDEQYVGWTSRRVGNQLFTRNTLSPYLSFARIHRPYIFV